MNLEAVKDNELDVVVALADQHLTVAVGSGLDGRGGVGEGDQRDRAFVHHRAAGALQQRQDDLDVLALLVGVAAAHLPDQLQHCHLQDVPPVRHIVHLCMPFCMSRGTAFLIKNCCEIQHCIIWIVLIESHHYTLEYQLLNIVASQSLQNADH